MSKQPATDCKQMLTQLLQWVELGALRALDLALARFVHEQADGVTPAVLLATALLSERNSHGHVCLNLQQALTSPGLLLNPTREAATATSEAPETTLRQWLAALDLASWSQQLLACEAVADQRDHASGSNPNTPLVLAGSAGHPRLYLRRYWQHEQTILRGIQQRLACPVELPAAPTRDLLQRLFPAQAMQPDWQQVSCLLAARSRFAIITGGPGTGKTTTVVRLLALLQGLQQARQQAPLNIRLAAPTGKAAARLGESITANARQLPLDPHSEASWLASIPGEVSTLHRLLGSRPDTNRFRHHAGNPLLADLVVVDEASMVDVEMLANLTLALGPETRLILLGDKDQLASVEAGSVLGDLCQEAERGHYQPETRDWLLQMGAGDIGDSVTLDDNGTALHQSTAMLRHSYRFAAHPGIGELAQLVNSGAASPRQLQQVFQRYQRRPDRTVDAQHNLELLQLPRNPQGGYQRSALRRLLREGYRGYMQQVFEQAPAPGASLDALNSWARSVFEQHQRFQLLTATRSGEWGVEGLNALTLAALREDPALLGQLPERDQLWYAGRPVLVTRNDYSLKLMNGDIGICLPWPTGEGPQLRVAFSDGNNGMRWLLPSRLQSVETVFAMTVHKSQGSEFHHTTLVLPDYSTAVLTKELLYTGITRAREAFTLVYSDEHVLQQLLRQRVVRSSGLMRDAAGGHWT